MSPVEKVFFDCPDGVARELRATLGARKRISELTGKSMALLITEQDGGAFPVILWAMMHDAEGNPPDISIKWLEENVPMEDAAKAWVRISAAFEEQQGTYPRGNADDVVAFVRHGVSTDRDG